MAEWSPGPYAQLKNTEKVVYGHGHGHAYDPEKWSLRPSSTVLAAAPRGLR
jgi:hypothetical protein